MPAYVRRQPLTERLKSFLNPYDFLLWLSEEIESNGWDQLEKEWAIPIGVFMNLLFLIARANLDKGVQDYDDVFADIRGPGWVAGFSWFTTHILTFFCILNAFYTFFRKRSYRLFENPVDVVPSTPSAHRVKVNSSPVSSSPLRFLSTMLGSESADSRAHPDPQSDVWELSVWDPLPVSLRLFCYFSPGHVIVYWLFLPTLSADPRPSTTVATAILLALLITLQLSFLTRNFSQQSKDSALISKEVLHEYDTKYVRPRTQPIYRDVGTQFTEQASYSEHRDEKYNTVDTYTPTVVINRGFKTNPNPNYMTTGDGEAAASRGYVRDPLMTPDLRHSGSRPDLSTPLRPGTAMRQPSFRPTSALGDGGSLGVYSHAGSPLKKSASTHFSPAKSNYVQDVAKSRQSMSPEKQGRNRKSVPAGGISTSIAAQRWGHLKPDVGRRESGRF